MGAGNPNITDVSKATQFKPGQSGNLKGNYKGTKHINTWVQEILGDPDFEAKVRIGFEIKDFKGAPIKAIVQAQLIKAIEGDTNAYKALVDSGWAKKLETDNVHRLVAPIMSLEESNAIPGNNSNQEG